MKRRGFTIVEIMIVTAIIGVLLILNIINMANSEVNARDSERMTDIESIAMHLENYYTSGTDGSILIGRYPSTALNSNGIDYMTQTLRDVDVNSLTAPGVSTSGSSFIAATNSEQSETLVTPQPTIDQYVYQPLELLSNGTWALCTSDTTQECRKFNLYYRAETDNTVYAITSKNQ
jgi:prepilin-type N-terminal cleavage/methylation domain-containing protein